MLGSDFDKSNGVYIRDKVNATVRNCFMEKCGMSGVQIRNSKDVSVLNNIFFAGAGYSDISTYSSEAPLLNFGRIVFQGNFCLSNVSQGIFLDPLGWDADAVIIGNICVTLDPATCVEGGTWSEIANGGSRRHGIIVGYQPSAVYGQRCVVSGNLCRNTRWTGIYKTSSVGGSTRGPTIISSNICSKNGYDPVNPGGLSGGIYVTQQGHELVCNNYIVDFQGAAAGSGGITVNNSGSITDPCEIVENVVQDSLTLGLFISTNATNVQVEGNTFINNTSVDIYVALNAGHTNIGGISILRNRIFRNNGTVGGLHLDMQASELITVVDGNQIVGVGDASATASNSGIFQFGGNEFVEITNNRISGFYYGCYYGAMWPTGRNFDAQLTRNTVRDCAVGFAVAGDADCTVPLTDNVFINTPIKTNTGGLGGVAAGFVCTKSSDKLVVNTTSSAPANGTWAIGDKSSFDDPTVSGYVGSVVTSLTPLTWKLFGALAP